jgi:hypothetical protein
LYVPEVEILITALQHAVSELTQEVKPS